ncbi:MAG: Sec-independent protein translocase family protein [Planctomycetota bacterium]
MSTKSAFVVLLVAGASLFGQAGCNEDHPASSPTDSVSEVREPHNESVVSESDNVSEAIKPDGAPGPVATDWPVSAAPPDNSPRDLLWRCHNSQRNGTVHEYLACYRGNDPAYREAAVGAFRFAEAHLELRRVVEEHYGQGAWERFKTLSSFVQPQDLGGGGPARFRYGQVGRRQRRGLVV